MMRNLPTELLIIVIAKFDNIKDKKTLANLRLVCRKFRDLATPSYFSYISFCYCLEYIPNQLNNLVYSGLVEHVRHVIFPVQSVVPRAWTFEKPIKGYTLSWESLQERMGKRCPLIHPEPPEDDMARAWTVRPVDKIEHDQLGYFERYSWTKTQRVEQKDSLFKGIQMHRIPQDPQRDKELRQDIGYLPGDILEKKEAFSTTATPFFEHCSKNLVSIRFGIMEYHSYLGYEDNASKSLARILRLFRFPRLRFLHLHLQKTGDLYIILGQASVSDEVLDNIKLQFSLPSLSVLRLYAQNQICYNYPDLPPPVAFIGHLLAQNGKSLNDIAVKSLGHHGVIGNTPPSENLKLRCSNLRRLALVQGSVDAKSLYSTLEASPHLKEIRLSFLMFDNRDVSHITLKSVFDICSTLNELTFVDVEWLVYASRAGLKMNFAPQTMTKWYRAPPLKFCSADHYQDLLALRHLCNVVSLRREQRCYEKHPIFEIYQNEDCDKAERMPRFHTDNN